MTRFGNPDKRVEGASMEIVRSRLDAQRISSTAFTRPAEVVAWLGAVQAQDYLGALWAVGLRLASGHQDDVERAIAERTIVRSWPMRGTLHFLSADDARWMIELLAPRAAMSAVNRLRAMGIDDPVLASARRALIANLEGGRSLTRPAAYRVLEQARIRTAGQRGLMILWRLAHDGLVCFGARAGKQPTLVLLEEWLPQAKRMPRNEALGELARRYFMGHGPATLRDFAWWSGMTLTDSRRAIEIAGALLREERIADASYWRARAAAPREPRRAGTYALPAFDEFFVGYADRGAAVNPAHAGRLRPFDLLGPVIILDGRLVATWKRRLTRGKVVCTTNAIAPLNPTKRSTIRRALERYVRFVQHDGTAVESLLRMADGARRGR
jgi:hypothetical protein